MAIWEPHIASGDEASACSTEKRLVASTSSVREARCRKGLAEALAVGKSKRRSARYSSIVEMRQCGLVLELAPEAADGCVQRKRS